MAIRRPDELLDDETEITADADIYNQTSSASSPLYKSAAEAYSTDVQPSRPEPVQLASAGSTQFDWGGYLPSTPQPQAPRPQAPSTQAPLTQPTQPETQTAPANDFDWGGYLPQTARVVETEDDGLFKKIDNALSGFFFENKPEESQIDKAGLEKFRSDQQADAQIISARAAELGTDKKDRNYAMTLFDAAAAGLGNAVSSSLEYMGRETGSEFLSEIGRRGKLEAAALTPNEQDIVQKVSGGVGSILAYATPGLGVAKGMQLLGATTRLASFGGATVSGALESTSIAQETYEKVLSETGNEELARQQSYKAGLLNLPLNIILNKVGIFDESGSVFKRIQRSFLAEGTEEAGQNLLTNYLGFKPMGEGVSESFVVGGLSGGAFKAAQLALDRNIPPEIQEQVYESVQQDVTDGRQQLFDSLMANEKSARLLEEAGIETADDPRFDRIAMQSFKLQRDLEQFEILTAEERAARTKERGKDVAEAFGETPSSGVGVGTADAEPIIQRASVVPDEEARTLTPVGDAPAPVTLPTTARDTTEGTIAVAGEDIVARQEGFTPEGSFSFQGKTQANRFVTEAQANSFLTDKTVTQEGKKVTIPGYASSNPDLDFRVRSARRPKSQGGGTYYFIESKPKTGTTVPQTGTTVTPSATPAPTATTPAQTKQPSVTPTDKLPQDLAGAKPRYNIGAKSFALEFDSDIDKALYITSQTSKSKRDADYRAFLTANGLSDADISQRGAALRESVKQILTPIKDTGGTSAAPTVARIPATVTPKKAPAQKTTEKKTGERKTRKPTRADELKARLTDLADKGEIDQGVAMEAIAEIDAGDLTFAEEIVAGATPKTTPDTAQKDIDFLNDKINKELARQDQPTTFQAVLVPDSEVKDTGPIQRLAQLLGRRVVFFRVDKGPDFFEGVSIGGNNDTIYINVKNQRSYAIVFGHEFLHSLKRQTPEIYAQFLEDLAPYFKKSLINKLKGPDGDVDLDLLEESAANILGNQMGDFAFWQDLKKRNPSVFLEVANKFIEFVNNTISRLLPFLDEVSGLKNLTKAREAAVTAIDSYIKEVGAKTPVAEDTMKFAMSEKPGKFLTNPNFRRWFGNSKIRNADGTPKVMYHGTARDIKTFKPKQANAIFVTEDTKFAESFAGASMDWVRQHLTGKAKKMAGEAIYPVFVRAEDTFDYDNPRHIDRVKTAYIEASEDAQIAEDLWDLSVSPALELGSWRMVEEGDVQRAIRNAGFDSFYVFEAGRKNLGVIDPNQIKSATGNSGEFSLEKNDIRFSRTKPERPESEFRATPEDIKLANEYEKENGILPYVSAGKIDIPVDDVRFSIKTESKYDSYDAATGLPLNKDGTATLYFPTTNEEARRINNDKTLRAPGTERRIYLTNESSGWKTIENMGNMGQQTDGSVVIVNIDPALLQLDQEFTGGRKDFFIATEEGQYFNDKMRMFALHASRAKPISLDATYDSLTEGVSNGINEFDSLDKKGQTALLKEVRELLKVEHNIGTLLTENGKLEKTKTGDYGLTYEGKSVASLGLGLASAQKLSPKLNSCPNHAKCEGLCLGDTAGGNKLYGGMADTDVAGSEKSAFRAGPRLSQFLKTEAFIVHPREFAILLHSEILAFKRWAAKNDYTPAIRLNVTSDIPPFVMRSLIDAHPDVQFYDYTKLGSDSISPNHHLTYSSTGFSQIIKGKKLVNPGNNWNTMRSRLDRGFNVAMAFTSKTDMPSEILDEESGRVYQVWDGDNYDARFLDPKREDGIGMIVGLTNKDATLKRFPELAAEKSGGFFVDYDRKRDGERITVPDQRQFKSAPRKSETGGKFIPISVEATSPVDEDIKFSRIVGQADSDTTQVATTSGSYKKAAEQVKEILPTAGRVLDYGAGLGLGTDAMRDVFGKRVTVDSYEPLPGRWSGKVPVTYTSNDDIEGTYDAVVNLNVLNVLEPDIRDAVTRDILNKISPGGVAVIGTRGWNSDVATAKNFEPADEPKAIYVLRKRGGQTVRVYQKGFDGRELADYIAQIAGPGYEVSPSSGIAKTTAIVRRVKPTTTVEDTVEEDVRFSLKPGWEVRETGRKDNFIYLLQDKQIDLKRVIDGIKTAGKQIADKWDAYLQEELFHGRSAKQTKDFLERELQPLLRDMAKDNISIEALDDYLHARHAVEANRQIARVNPNMPDGGSGLTNQQARDLINKIPPARRAKLESLAKRVDNMTKGTRELMVNYGLETRDTINTWEKTYQNYVPLFREETEGGSLGIGQGYSIRGSSSRRRVGSRLAVVDVLANIAMQRERVISRGEKNRVGNALFGMVVQNPNQEFWLAVNPDVTDKAKLRSELLSMGIDPAEAENISAAPKQRYIDPRTGKVAFRVNPVLTNSPNVLVTRVNGQDRLVIFSVRNERAARMASAMKNLDGNQMGQAVAMMGQAGEYFQKTVNSVGTATRYFAAINTQYNPAFGLYNFLRDVGGATLNLSSTPLKGKEREIIGNSFTALVGIYRDLRLEREGKQPDSQWAKLFEEFEAEGGKTGFRDMFNNAQDRAVELEKELRRFGEGGLKARGRAVMEWLSDFNEAIENAIRLSAYKTGKESGMTNERAASLAKNLTVNFNRKGALSNSFSTLYAFFNASAQGTARIAQTLFTSDGKLSRTGKAIVKGGLYAGVAQAVLLAMAGFEEDEPPEFVRDKSFIIPTGDGKYLAIPMPLGYNAIPSFSRRITEFIMSNDKNVGKTVVGIAGMVVDSFNPLGSATLAQTIAPTVVDPIIALAENEDFAGRPIAREDVNTLDPTPGYTRAKENASAISKGMAYTINLLSGGTDYKQGAISPTPDQIDYLIGQITGGVGRELLKIEKSATSVATGEELATYNIPIVGRMVGNLRQKAVETSRFYDNVKLLNEHQREIEGRIKDGKDIDEYYAENPEATLFQQGDSISREIQQLRRNRKALKENGETPEALRELDEIILGRMKSLNDAVKEQKSTKQ